MERTIRLDLNDQRARSDLASFGAEVDALIKSLSRVDVDLVIEDSSLRAIQKSINSLNTVVDIDLQVDDDQLNSAINEVADLSGSVVDVGLSVDTDDLQEAEQLLEGLQRTVDADVQVDTDDIRSALDLLADLDESISSKITIDDSELDAAVREANSFPDPIDTKIDVDSGALDEAAGLAAGVGFGAAVSSGFTQALSLDSTVDLVTAQLGLTVDAAEQAGQVAADVYSGAWGDSVEQVGEALTSVGQNLVDLNTVGAAELENLTIKSLDLATALDEDVGGVTRTVGQLVRTGLAKDFDDAFDIIAAGLQNGANRGEDLLDTFNEYSTSFAGLGLSAEDALGILNNGLEAGVDNTDRIADGLREFRIRVQDGTVAGIEGFDRLGVSAAGLESAIAAGGPAARAAFQEVVQGLQQIEDPVERDRLAFQIFGTQLEDFGVNAGEVFAITEDAIGKVSGAAEQLGIDLNDNASVKIEEFRRTALLGLTDFVANTVIPVLEKVGPPLLLGLQAVVSFVQTQVLPVLTAAFAFLGEQLDLFIAALQSGTSDGSFLQDIAVFIVNELIPAVQELGQVFLSDVLPQVVQFVQDQLVPGLGQLGEVIVNDVLPVWLQLADVFVRDVLPVLVSIGTFVSSTLIPVLVGFASVLIGDVVPVVLDVVSVVFQFLAVLDDLNLLIPLLVVAVATIGGPFTLLGAAILGVITFLITLYQRFELVRNIVDGVIDVIQFLVNINIELGRILFEVGSVIAGVLISAFSRLEPVLRVVITIFGVYIDIIRALVSVVSGQLSGLPGVISNILSTVGNIWNLFWSGLSGIVSRNLEIVRGVISSVLSGLSGVVSGVLSGVGAVWNNFWNGLSFVVSSVINAVTNLVRTGFGQLGAVISQVMNGVANVVVNSWNIVTNIFSSAVSRVLAVVANGFAGISGLISQSMNTALNAVQVVLGAIAGVFSSGLSRIGSIVSIVFGGVVNTIGSAMSTIFRRISTVLSSISTIWSRVWGGIRTITRSVAVSISSFMNTIIRAVNRILGPIREALRLIGRLGGVVSSLPSPGDLIPSLPSLPTPGGIIGGIGDIIGGVLPIDLFGDGGVVTKPTLAMIGERGGREAVVPEYASLAAIKQILGKTNVLDRLAQDFSAQQRAVFTDFNDRAATDSNLSGPTPPPPPGETFVDRSTHQYDLKIVDGSGTMASKQRTASTVVSEIQRRRKPPTRPGPGSWRNPR